MAASAGVSILALTDHDSIAGNPEAAAESMRAGIDFVPGIEVSALEGDMEYHILGYFVESSPALSQYVDGMALARARRLEEIVSRLRRAGLDVDVERIRGRARGVATRSHVAEFLVSTGSVDSVPEAFQRYLGPGCAGYVPAATLSVEGAIDLIHSAGGCASLAHPGEWVDDRDVRAFRDYGLDAVETVHPSHDRRLTDYYAELARSLGLLETGGSDFHALREGGAAAPGSFWVPSDRVDALRRRTSRYGPEPATDL